MNTLFVRQQRVTRMNGGAVRVRLVHMRACVHVGTLEASDTARRRCTGCARVETG